MPIVAGSIGERLLAGQTGTQLVVGKNVVKLDGVRHRHDGFCVDFRELIDVGHDLSQLVGERSKFGFAQLEAGETVRVRSKDEFEALARQTG